MFSKKTRKSFHVSTEHFYVVTNRKEAKDETMPARLLRGGYRSKGILVAL